MIEEVQKIFEYCTRARKTVFFVEGRNVLYYVLKKKLKIIQEQHMFTIL